MSRNNYLKYLAHMKQIFLPLTALFLLVSCTSAEGESSTHQPSIPSLRPTRVEIDETQQLNNLQQTAIPTKTQTQLFQTPSPGQLRNWESYQEALANTFFPPPLEITEAICEWEILDQNGKELYVWAVCSGYHSPGQLSSGSMPAVIVVDQSGSIQEIRTTENTPASSFKEAQQLLFSEEILEQLSTFNGERYFNHLEKRRETHTPPLIVLNSTSIPNKPTGTVKPAPTENTRNKRPGRTL